MKVRILFILMLAALANCRKPDRPEALIFRDGFAVGNDTTAPLVVSVTGEAGTDQLLVEFNEPVYTTAGGSGNLVTGDFSYQDNNATGATGITAMFEANGADRIVVLTTNANLIAGDNGDRVTFPANSIYDAAGNALAATDKLIVLTIVPPTLVGAETMDTNRNGKIDHLKLTFNKNLTDATFPNYVNTSTLGGVTTAWLVAGFTNVRIDPTIAADVDNDNIVYLTWTEGASTDTALKPDLTTTAGPALQATNGATVNQIFTATVAETDGTPPVLLDATEKAGEKDLVLSFSEPVYTNSNATGNLILGDFSYTNNNPTGATALSNITEADGSDKSITLQMDSNFVSADHLTDRVAVVTNEIYDAAGLATVNCQTGTHCGGTYVTTRITNGDAPVLQSAETMDVDGNGKIDHYKLTFDVPVSDASFPGHAGNNALGTVTTQWLIAGRSNVRIDTRDAVPPAGPGDIGTNDNAIYLAFDESANACADNDISGCDTGAKPDLTTTVTPGLADLDPTNFPQLVSGGVIETDKVSPMLISAKAGASTQNLTLRFSEAVFTNSGGTGDLIESDISYANTSGSNATTVATVIDGNAADGKVTFTASTNFALADEADGVAAVSNQIFDAVGNSMVAISQNVRVAPVLLTAETMDIDADGYIDHMKLTFGSAVDDSTFPGHVSNGLGTAGVNWLLTSQGNTRLDTRTATAPNGPGDVANDTVLYLAFTGSSDTAFVPDLTTTTTPGLRIAGSANQMQPMAAGDLNEQDRAIPRIVGAGVTSSTQLMVNFSEPVYTNAGAAGNLVPTDFAYGNVATGGATAIASMAEGDGADRKVTLILDAAFLGTDSNQDSITSAASEIFDAAGNAAILNPRKILGTPRYVADGGVLTMIESGGTLYMGGNFTMFGPIRGSGVPIDGTAAAIPAGMINHARINGRVQVAIADVNGGFLIGGDFTSVGGISRNRIARINADGSLNSWNPNANGGVITLAVSGTKIFVGGNFTNIGGQGRNNIAALDATTGLATSWNPNANGSISAIAVSGSTVYIGGGFTTIGATSRNYIAALDASIDENNATAWNPNADGSVSTLAISGGTIYAGGFFTMIGGSVRNRVAAIDATTGLATSWNPNANGSVSAMAVSGSTVYISGGFSTIGVTSRNNIAAISTAGSLTSWNPNANGIVSSLAVSGTTIYAGGTFTTIGGQTRKMIAALNTAVNTNNATNWDPNANAAVLALAISGNVVYAGGDFSSMLGQVRNRLAALDATGQLTSWNPNADNTVNTLAVSGTTIYAGGNFTNVSGVSRLRLAAIDNAGNLTSWDPGANNTVYSMATSGSTIYVGGDFSMIVDQVCDRIGAISSAGFPISSWLPNANGTVYALAVSGSTVYAGGDFTFIGGASRARIAGLDSSGNATAFAGSANGIVRTIVAAGSTLYVGGDFTFIGPSRNYIAALDSTTGTATSWNPNAGNRVNALVVSGTTLYAAGLFTTIGGQTRSRIAALDTTINTNNATSWNPNASGGGTSLAITGTTVYIGGNFSTIGGLGISRLGAIDLATGQALEY
jgi:hypothetical protein